MERFCKKSFFHQWEFPCMKHLTNQKCNVFIWSMFAHLPVSMNHSSTKSLLDFHLTSRYCHFVVGELDSCADIKQLLALYSLQKTTQHTFHQQLKECCWLCTIEITCPVSLLLWLLLFTVRLHPEVALHLIGVPRMGHLKHCRTAKKTWNNNDGFAKLAKLIGCKMVECAAKFIQVE